MFRTLIALLIITTWTGCSDEFPGVDDQVIRDARAGDAKAQYTLGNLLREQNNEESVKWYRKAAEQGHAGAQGLLGYMYFVGKGVPEDSKEALTWWRTAADQGDAGAQCNLANCYMNGEGVAPDPEEAVSWWRRAADQGRAEAQLSLGHRLLNGEGVAQNHVAAYAWYHLLATREDQPTPTPDASLRDTGPVDIHASAPDAHPLVFSVALRSRNSLAGSMTPEQIAEARELSRKLAARIETNEKKSSRN